MLLRQHYKLPINWERTRFTRVIKAILNWL